MVQEIKIKLFGSLIDVLNQEEIILQDVENIDNLKIKLFVKYPALLQKDFAIAVNQKIIQQNINIDSSSEIALLPPFSGG